MKGWGPILLATVLAFSAGALAGWHTRDFFAVDVCLDAGGAWKGRGYCVGARSE